MIDTGEKVRLGPLRHENSGKYYQARNDYRIWKWCRQFDLLREDEHETWLMLAQTSKSIRMYEVLARTSADSEGKRPAEDFTCVGVCGLTDIDHVNQRAEFSLYIFPEHSRHGYGRAALSTLLTHGFSSLNLNRIWGETFEGNPAAEMFEEMGFDKEGRRRDFYFREGKFIDAHLYSMGRREWLKQS